ncbi:hypothetical protein [Ectopseudomonas mendocina]|uniref:hypothetical protein n=1 Tax=Ectopseudomonas mendocina TaxID=300 RepID=UPI00376EE694
MPSPFEPSAAVSLKPATTSLAANFLLLLLAAITVYLLWGDVNYLLATQKGTLTKAGSVSLLHHLYLSVIPFEIAYFRLATSALTLAFIIFSLRNHQVFSTHTLPVYLYGIAQLAFYILAMTAILGILNQVSDNRLFDATYWSGPIATSLAKSILVIIAMHLTPPIAFLATCHAAKARIIKQAKT